MVKPAGEAVMRCERCGKDGAVLRYQYLYRYMWFHPRCWHIARTVEERFEAKGSAAALTDGANTDKVGIAPAESITTQPANAQSDEDAQAMSHHFTTGRYVHGG